jgi:arginase
VVLIGTRSYSPEEEELLRELGVKIFFAEEVNRRGVEEVLKEGITHISQHTVGYGISLDLDCFNPEYVQAVSDPVSGGIDPIKLLSAFETVLPESPPLGIGLSEYNPWFDQDRETFAYIQEILLAISLCQQTEKQRLVPLRG